jgi:dienelactone hydrolase
LVLVLALARAAAAGNVTIPATGTLPAITGDLERPSGSGPFPAVLILHGCEGFGPLDVQTAQALARQGYAALAIDTLTPQHLKNACTDSGSIPTSARLAYVSLAWLAQQPFVTSDRLGIVGFSMGSIETLALVDPLSPRPPPPGLRAAVTYYPACAQRSPNVGVPLLILDGVADDWTPAAPCQALAQAASAAGNTVKIVTYPGVTHAFNQPSNGSGKTYLGHHLVYDAAATQDASEQAAAFLATYLKPAP